MISKNQIKLVTSLHKAKGRKRAGLFIVEGPKAVDEFINSNFEIEAVYGTREWIEFAPQILDFAEMISVKELQSISAQKHPNQVLAVVKMPETSTPPSEINDLCLVLDTIQDPGNMGTIIRIADWFGIKHIICSTETADIYNPKVVQSTMGSISRVQVSYTDLVDWLGEINGAIPVYGTLLSGENIYETKLVSKGLIVIGNESKGISDDVAFFISQGIKIPSYGDSETESLNAAVATGVVVAVFRQAQ
ncbi:MAG: RNA methyltransferase [Bacteroidales bacterium]|nr:RNA methyltransferase [Bacteroidales bacterium]